MNKLLITLCFTLLSFNHSSYALVDPDSLDSSMNTVSYLIAPENLKIIAYHLGSPSKLKVKLCRACLEKTYLLDPKAELKIFRQPLEKGKLTEFLLKKQFPLRLTINRSKGMIIYLHIGASPNDELPPPLITEISGSRSIRGLK